MGRTFKLATRGSTLALWQAEWVANSLRRLGIEVELLVVSTSGDRFQGPIGAGSDVGLFTKEIQRAVLAGDADLAVHSVKDLPTAEVPELVLAAVPPRATVSDALILSNSLIASNTVTPPSGQGVLDLLPPHSRVGTGSLRRRAQLLHARPDLVMEHLRGNVESRLRKLEDQHFDAIVLAAAGLERLGLAPVITQLLPLELMLPAVGQGALGIETRCDDDMARQAVAALDDAATHAAALAERAMLAALQGGCLAPIAAWARPEPPGSDSQRLAIWGRVLAADGSRRLDVSLDAPMPGPADFEQAAALGRQAAQSLLDQGAASLVEQSRQQ